MTERSRLQTELTQAQKMESVGRLAGGVAHDFNNMLGAIMGHAEIAIDKLGRGMSVRSNLDEILKASRLSADLTRQLLAFARKQTASPVALEPNELVGSMLVMLRRLIGENIELSWLPGSDVWPIRIDPTQLDQILTNLCVNARDAIGENGTISIETGNESLDSDFVARHPGSQTGDFVRIAVSDDGEGMQKEVIEHIFEPFFTTKELGRGTGLGLATVYGIVKQNQGFIDVWSEPDHGTRIEVFLPRNAGLPDSQTAVPDQAERGGGETVLMVEDEAMVRELGAEMLRLLGYNAVTAASPAEALAMARSRTLEISLLMTDVVMPGMNGRELVEEFELIFPGIKHLYMSGYTADVIAHQGVLREGVHFIQKPFGLVDLSNKLREALGA
jgi:two-component system, cell cycle sensor histidine kinase and response regulator CckA